MLDSQKGQLAEFSNDQIFIQHPLRYRILMAQWMLFSSRSYNFPYFH
jgi:hypothetical protein